MKIDLLTSIVLINTIISGCHSVQKKENLNGGNHEIEVNSKYEYSGLPVKNICILDENIDLVGTISSCDFIDESHYVVATVNPASIFIYTLKGEQIREIKKTGSGPFEYINPSIVRGYNKKIYVWCSQQLKLTVYDMEGNGIKEYAFFDKAIKSFELWEDYVIMYVSGGYRDNFIKIFDLEKEQEVFAAGEKTNEHIMLSLMYMSGGLSISNDTAYYGIPDKLLLKKINLRNFTEELFITLKDRDFFVTPVTEEPMDIINKKRDKAIDYVGKNSIVMGVFVTSKHIIMKTEIGEFINKGNYYDQSKRHNKFYYFDKMTSELIFTVKSPMESNNNSLYMSNKDGLYHIREDINKEDMRYELLKIDDDVVLSSLHTISQ
ncbi:MAG: 6-bladed beta-propeller [Prevotellaceae bacterium]|nr:6-bladed beta-propeller [Prevotellaceae bacterium]